jgi:tetratricopeptide (TPR) repeat protein
MSDAAPSEADVRLLQDTIAAAQAGETARAMDLAEKALADGLEHPVFRRLRGLKREQAGRIADAAADFQAALADQPDDPALMDLLGLCLARLGRFAEALRALDAAVRLQPGLASAHANRAWVRENLGDLAAAREGYRQAIALDPSLARAQSALALLAARAGRWAEAREAAKGALGVDPQERGARLALAMADFGEGDAAAAEAGARELLTPQMPPHDRGVVLTLIGDAADRQDRTAEAFGAWASANETLRQLQSRQFGPGLQETGSAAVARLQRAFDRTSPEDWRAPREAAPEIAPAAGHVFVLGFPRSGTTFLGQVLGAHPQVTTMDEVETLGDAGRSYLADEAGLARLAAAPEAELEGYRAAYWRRVRAMGVEPEGRVVVDKLPMNTLGLPLIARLFPQAKVVFVRRDPRDVLLSCFRRQFTPSGMSFEFLSLEGAARYYDAVMTLAEAYRAALPLDLSVLRYEGLVADFPAETGKLLAFLDLAQDPAVTGFAGAAKPEDIATPSAAQVTGGVSGEGVGQWRRYQTQLAPAIRILAPWIDAFGY